VTLHGGIRGYWQISSLGGDLRMNPVIGLDVSKGESQVQAFLKLTLRILYFFDRTNDYIT